MSTDPQALVAPEEIANAAVAENMNDDGSPKYGSAQGYACALSAIRLAAKASSPADAEALAMLESISDLLLSASHGRENLDWAGSVAWDLRRIAAQLRASLAREAAEPPCSCLEVYGEDPRCISHGEGTQWRKANPDLCELYEKAARATALERQLEEARGVMEPFAELADNFVADDADDLDLYSPPAYEHQMRVRIGWLRAADRFLKDAAK